MEVIDGAAVNRLFQVSDVYLLAVPFVPFRQIILFLIIRPFLSCFGIIFPKALVKRRQLTVVFHHRWIKEAVAIEGWRRGAVGGQYYGKEGKENEEVRVLHGAKLELRDGKKINLRSWPSYFAPVSTKNYFRS